MNIKEWFKNSVDIWDKNNINILNILIYTIVNDEVNR
jgi:hypothetical protein